MASAASMRLPWRAMVRSAATRPSSAHLFRASQHATSQHTTLPIRQQLRCNSSKPPSEDTPSPLTAEDATEPETAVLEDAAESRVVDESIIDGGEAVITAGSEAIDSSATTSDEVVVDSQSPVVADSTSPRPARVFETVLLRPAAEEPEPESSAAAESTPARPARVFDTVLSSPELSEPVADAVAVTDTTPARPARVFETVLSKPKLAESEADLQVASDSPPQSTLAKVFSTLLSGSTAAEPPAVAGTPPTRDSTPAAPQVATESPAQAESPTAPNSTPVTYTPFTKDGNTKDGKPRKPQIPRLPANPNYPKQTAPQSVALVKEEDGDRPKHYRVNRDSDVAAMYANKLRLPRSVQAVYLRPLKRTPVYSVPTCDLQIRSYSVRNLEFFCDFALRAAYYLGLPASGPVPLPRITERWTVPRANFIHKKSQENFERRTVRRLIQIKDGDAESQELWLAFLRKHAYYGVGMKANVWEFARLGVGKEMDAQVEKMKDAVGSTLDNLAFSKLSKLRKNPLSALNEANFRQASGMSGPMMDKQPKGTWPVGRKSMMSNQGEFLDYKNLGEQD